VNVGTGAGTVRAVSGGSGNITAAAASQALTGGTGYYAGNVVTISGVACKPYTATGTSPAATWTDTAITAVMPDMTAETPARAAADTVVAKVSSNGIKSGGISFALGT
jgi:hypothetical protein